jgi:hypothetical protein
MIIATEVSSATSAQPHALLESVHAPSRAAFPQPYLLRLAPTHGLEITGIAQFELTEFLEDATPQRAPIRIGGSTVERAVPSAYRFGLSGVPVAGLVEAPAHPALILMSPAFQSLPVGAARGASSHFGIGPTGSHEVMSVFEGIGLDELEDGMTAALGQRLDRFVERFGPGGIDALAGVLLAGDLPPELVSHTLRWLGRMRDPGSFHARLWLLRHSLRFPSPVVRDGAALGLAALGSPLAIPSLEAAIQRERYPGLRQDLRQVLEDLRERR